MTLSVKQALRSKKIILFSTLATLLFLVVLVVGLVISYPSENNLQFKTLVDSFLERVSFKEKSYAKLSYGENSINLSFDIAAADLDKVARLSQKLDIKNDWMKGISITLDKETVDLLKGNLPEKIALKFEDEGLSFTSPSSPLLRSSLSGENYQIATVSGSLTLNASSPKDYDIKIIEPAAVLEYAQASGKVYLSTKGEGSLPLLRKIARIEIVSRNGEIKGLIRIKN